MKNYILQVGQKRSFFCLLYGASWILGGGVNSPSEIVSQAKKSNSAYFKLFSIPQGGPAHSGRVSERLEHGRKKSNLEGMLPKNAPGKFNPLLC